jgi:uncharacterized protein YbaA (DUF1428 family)
MDKMHSTLLRTLGVAHVLVAIILLPANLFLGFLTIPIVLPAQIWLFFLGLRLWRPDARIKAALRVTHLLLAPFAVLLVIYGVYAVRAATHSAKAGGGLLGSFGLIPITLGVCSGLLALWSLYVAYYTQLDFPEKTGSRSAQRGVPDDRLAARRALGYVDGFVAAVPAANRGRYLTHARRAALVFKEHGALNVVECWGDDIPDGVTTSFPLAVNCRAGETVVFSWITWPSKEARNAGMKKVMADPRLSPQSNPMPFDGQRMINGGFAMIVDE